MVYLSQNNLGKINIFCFQLDNICQKKLNKVPFSKQEIPATPARRLAVVAGLLHCICVCSLELLGAEAQGSAVAERLET